MPRQSRIKSESGLYHIMLRGNERKNIFHEEEDKLRFIEILRKKKDDNPFILHAFCLMDNHIHLMIQEGIEDIAGVMKRVNVSYVHYFNKKYKRVGHLFQDRFRSEIVENDNYILALVRYIHQNPIKAGMVASIDEYKWSSHHCYLKDEGRFLGIVNTDKVLGYFSEDKKIARIHYEEYMGEKDDGAFIDFIDGKADIRDEEAKELFERMMFGQSSTQEKTAGMEKYHESLLKEFKKETDLSLRRLANITGLNKNKISKILRS